MLALVGCFCLYQHPVVVVGDVAVVVFVLSGETGSFVCVSACRNLMERVVDIHRMFLDLRTVASRMYLCM